MQMPYAIERRPDTGLTNGQLGMWLFIASEVMLFGALFSSYVILRVGATEWPREALNIGAALANTVVLLLSSWLLALSMASLRAGLMRPHRLRLFAAVALALIFLVIKSFEYREHWLRHELPATNTFFAIYYTLTGLHALHIAGGVMVMLHLLGAGRKPSSAGPAQLLWRLRYTALYWYFVDAIWICLLVLLYLW